MASLIVFFGSLIYWDLPKHAAAYVNNIGYGSNHRGPRLEYRPWWTCRTAELETISSTFDGSFQGLAVPAALAGADQLRASTTAVYNFVLNHTSSLKSLTATWVSSLAFPCSHSIWEFFPRFRYRRRKSLSPWLRDIVNSSIGLSYRPAMQPM
jgi:hypothetical protein